MIRFSIYSDLKFVAGTVFLMMTLGYSHSLFSSEIICGELKKINSSPSKRTLKLKFKNVAILGDSVRKLKKVTKKISFESTQNMLAVYEDLNATISEIEGSKSFACLAGHQVGSGKSIDSAKSDLEAQGVKIPTSEVNSVTSNREWKSDDLSPSLRGVYDSFVDYLQNTYAKLSVSDITDENLDNEILLATRLNAAEVIGGLSASEEEMNIFKTLVVVQIAESLTLEQIEGIISMLDPKTGAAAGLYRGSSKQKGRSIVDYCKVAREFINQKITYSKIAKSLK